MGFGCNGMGWGGWGSWGGPGILGLILGALLWAALVAALVAGIVWLARRLGRQGQGGSREETPLGVAKRRLSAGEITVSEYDEIVHRLRTEPAHADQ